MRYKIFLISMLIFILAFTGIVNAQSDFRPTSARDLSDAATYGSIQELRILIEALAIGFDTAIPKMHADTVSGKYTANPLWVGAPIPGSFPDPAKDPIVDFQDWIDNSNLIYESAGGIKITPDTVAWAFGDDIDTTLIAAQTASYQLADSLSPWIITIVDAGSDNDDFIGIALDTVGGALQLTTNDNDNDMNVMQRRAAVLRRVSGTEEDFYYETMFHATDWIQHEFLFGHFDHDTTPFTSLQDGIGFRKSDADTTVYFVIISSGTEYLTEIIASDRDSIAWHTAGYKQQDGIIYAYYDETLIKTIEADSLPSDVVLALTKAIKNGLGEEQTMFFEYDKTIMERVSR